MPRVLITLAMFFIFGSVNAFEIEQPSARTGTDGPVTIFRINGFTFTLTDIPNSADRFEVFDTKPAEYEDGMKTLTLGKDVTQEEAARVIEEHYRENAFDFKSIKVRGLKILGPKFVAWCSSPSLFFCLERQFRSGTWIEFEVNGANRSGGLTGYQQQIFLIRKIDQLGQ